MSFEKSYADSHRWPSIGFDESLTRVAHQQAKAIQKRAFQLNMDFYGKVQLNYVGQRHEDLASDYRGRSTVDGHLKQ